MSVVGLVAAAGASTRMGRPKALLPFDDEESFAAHLVRVFKQAGLAPVVVTLPEPPHLAAVRTALSELDATLAPNREPALGLSGSVLTALAQAPNATGIVLTPVDVPFASVELVRALAEQVEEGAPAAVPVVKETWAHPVAFGPSSFVALKRAARARGPRTVLEALGDRLVEIEAHDERLLENVNTPEVYARVFSRSL